ncbi:SigE family RNA polymerase sigma factor [Catellatospora vulcania]|uniref:SigE family RNA polymerase sigma factor n=1 Tax=Catellatospora vulcania TaxID=1460450 RepID=UPI0012D3F52E|nr:SigE family RNA polymerase sigma factor [Catellatospora vulcania]
MAETATFDEFVVTRSRHLLRVAYLLTGDHGLAEDLLQTALARSWPAWRRIDGDPEPYVRRVLANTYNSWWRRRWHGERPTETLPERAAPLPHTAVDDRDQLRRALARLPRQQKVVLVLRYFEDLSEADIARTLGISAGSVKTHASKGLAKLRLDPTLRELPQPDDDGPVGNERLAAVRSRIAQGRRRSIAGIAAACLLALALIAAYALLPHLRTRAMPEPAFPVEVPQFAQSGRVFADVDYYRLTASAQHDYTPHLDPALTWTPSGRPEALFLTCRHLGELNTLIAYVQVNGRTAGRGMDLCNGEGDMGVDGFFAMLDPAALGLITGKPAVVTLDLEFGQHGDDPLPAGTVAVAIGEVAPYADLPWPGTAASHGPLDRTLHSGVDPATVTTLESSGAHSTTLTWTGPLTVWANTQTPGRLRILVDGALLTNLDFGTPFMRLEGGSGVALDPAFPYDNGFRFAPRPGATITITVEPERLVGDWYVAIYPQQSS